MSALVAQRAVVMCRSAHPSRQKFYRLHVENFHDIRRPKDSASEDGDDLEREAALDRRYRSRGTWWPVADPVVAKAMSEMVRCEIDRKQNWAADSTGENGPCLQRRAEMARND